MEDDGYKAVGAQEDCCVAELRGENEEKVVTMHEGECSLPFMDIFGYEYWAGKVYIGTHLFGHHDPSS